jgi:hypothetical protein
LSTKSNPDYPRQLEGYNFPLVCEDSTNPQASPSTPIPQPKSDTKNSPTAGGYNFPLICADFVITRICIDPDDWKGGGLGQVEKWV